MGLNKCGGVFFYKEKTATKFYYGLGGPEMCIRDRSISARSPPRKQPRFGARFLQLETNMRILSIRPAPPGGKTLCLLYTSDAADERSSVDLGGRRIIKKNKRKREKKKK